MLRLTSLHGRKSRDLQGSLWFRAAFELIVKALAEAVITGGIPPGPGRAFCQKAHSSRAMASQQEMSVSCHLELWEGAVECPGNMAAGFSWSTASQRARQNPRAFYSSASRVPHCHYTSAHGCTSQSVPVSAGETVEGREHWQLWTAGSYLSGLIS